MFTCLLDWNELNFEQQFKQFFPSMKKAEQNLKYQYLSDFTKNEKDIVDSKITSKNMNDKLLANINEIKHYLLERIKSKENKDSK